MATFLNTQKMLVIILVGGWPKNVFWVEAVVLKEFELITSAFPKSWLQTYYQEHLLG